MLCKENPTTKYGSGSASKNERNTTEDINTEDDKPTDTNEPKTEVNQERTKPGVSEPLEPPKEQTGESHAAGKAHGKTCCIMKVTTEVTAVA